MNREFFNKQYTAMAAAYITGQKLLEETQDVYWEMLQGIPEREFAKAVRQCLGHCKFFPTINELGEAALPTKRILGPYNPYAESIIELNWQAQVEQLTEQEALPDNVKSLVSRLSDAKKTK